MNRRLTLLATYERDPVPLERIAPEIFGLSYAKAREQIRAGKFPLLAFQASDSHKAPWLVSIAALADYLDERERMEQQRRDCVRSDLVEGMK